VSPRYHPTSYATLGEALGSYTVPELKLLAALLETRTPSRRDDVIRTITGHFSDEGVRALWESLDRLQKAAVAEAVHEGPMFDAGRFKARHGRLPDFGDLHHFRGRPTHLRLFLPGPGILPDDVRKKLLPFVPVPEPPALATLAALPATVSVVPRPWRPNEVEERPVVVREMEAAALHDLRAVLRLVEGSGIAVTDRKREPTAASVRAVAEVLLGGDFYRGEEGGTLGLGPGAAEQIGPIRAFALPMLVQAGGLAQRRGQRLAVTAAGRRALRETEPARV